MNESAFKELIDQYITGNLSAEDRASFALLLEKPEYQAILEAELERSFLVDEFEGTETAERKARLNKLIIERTISKPVTIVHRVHFLRRNWLQIAAAAVVLLVVGSMIFYPWRKPVQPEIVKTTIKPAATDIAPGGNRAKLMLSDGSVIMLDSMANGMLARQGNSNVVKQKDGQLIYSQAVTDSRLPLTYNMLTTPRGGQYQLARHEALSAYYK
jgi:transmembrane sensor